MTTPSAPATRRDIETALIEKCWKDPEFKKEFVSDPKGMLEKHIGQQLPAEMKIFVYEEDAQTVHFSIPPVPSNLTELSDEELGRIAGGTDVSLVALSIGVFASVVLTAGSAVGTVAKGW